MSGLNLNNTENINADSIFLVVGDEFKNIYDIFATIDDLNNVTGLDQNTINELVDIAAVLPNNTNWYQDILDALGLRALISETYSRTYIDFNHYKKGVVDQKFTDLIDGAPETYNTLNKLATAISNTNVSITGGASTIVTDNLIENRVLLSNNDGKVAVSFITTSELNCLDNVASNIQSQLDNKQNTIVNDSLNIAYTAGLQNALNLKANQATTYTKTEVNNEFTDLIDGAPETLNTLNKLAIAINSTSVSIDGAASSIVTDDLTPDFVLISNSSGKVAASNNISTTELNSLQGALSNITIQNQIYSKQNIITNDDLDIAHTAGLQTALNSKLDFSALQAHLGLNYYNKTVSDDRFMEKEPFGIETSFLSFKDLSPNGTLNVFAIKGGSNGIQFQDESQNDLLQLRYEIVDVLVPFKCHSTVELENDSLSIAYTSGLQTALNSKANQSTTYTKTEVEKLILFLDVDTFNVSVNAKTVNHPYSGGSAAAYYIEGIEAPVIHFKIGKTYQFTQIDSTNTGHPLLLYYDADKTNPYTENVQHFQNSLGSYVSILITNDTPTKLYYQCGNHSLMGNYFAVEVSIENLTNTEISYLDGITSNIQTQINNLNSGGGGTSLYYYNLKYDYEGGIFPIIKDPNSNPTTDTSVTQSVYDQAQLVRDFVLDQTVFMGHNIPILETLYNNANRLITEYSNNNLATFINTFSTTLHNWLYRIILRNSNVFGSQNQTLVTNIQTLFDNNTIDRKLSPYKNRYFPLVNDLLSDGGANTFPT